MNNAHRVTTLTVGMVLFDAMTQLDLTGPYEVFARMPETRVILIASTRSPVRTEWGLTITPDFTFDDSPDFDVLCVPGGWGVNAALEDTALLAFLRLQATHARFVTSVCSGALLLGAAGLLRGYRATTHWQSLELLRIFGAEPVAQRVVRDRNRITGAGVTSGIDFALVVAAELFGDMIAQQIQLAIEYAPDPPFHAGSPHNSPENVRRTVAASAEIALANRLVIIARVAQRES